MCNNCKCNKDLSALDLLKEIQILWKKYCNKIGETREELTDTEYRIDISLIKMLEGFDEKG